MVDISDVPDALNKFGATYSGLITLIGGIVGVAGFLFGIWRYQKERYTKVALVEKQKELDQARARLKNLEDFANGLNRYSKVM
jgi:hypothetical protein